MHDNEKRILSKTDNRRIKGDRKEKGERAPKVADQETVNLLSRA